jgi:hypothetical protein
MAKSRRPSLVQINTRVVLTELSRTLGRRATLDDIPDAQLDLFKARGFDWVWLLSVWQTGRDQLLAFMEARGVPGVPAHCEAGINRGLGVPNAFYHFAFEAGSEAALVEKRNELIARGVDVTDVVDHDWAKSIYFKDPNGLQLEFCCFTRNLNADDARLQERAEVSIRRMGLESAGAPSPTERVKVG